MMAPEREEPTPPSPPVVQPAQDEGTDEEAGEGLEQAAPEQESQATWHGDLAQ
jgi:hypothetical protein